MAKSNTCYTVFIYVNENIVFNGNNWNKFQITRKYDTYKDACIGLINTLNSNFIETYTEQISISKNSDFIDYKYSTLPLDENCKHMNYKTGKYICINEKEEKHRYNTNTYFGIVIDADLNCKMKDNYEFNTIYDELNRINMTYNCNIIHHNHDKCNVWSTYRYFKTEIVKNPIEPKYKYKKYGLSSKYTKKYLEYQEELKEFNDWYKSFNNVPIIIPIQCINSNDELLTELLIEFRICIDIEKIEYKMEKWYRNNKYHHDLEFMYDISQKVIKYHNYYSDTSDNTNTIPLINPPSYEP